MNTRTLLKALGGIHTIDSAADALKTSKKKAIYYVHRLRKLGYVRTKKLSSNKRVYDISFENRLNGTSYYEIINRYSPVKIAEPEVYRIYGKEPSIEETLVYAIKTKSLRTILASLALFRKISDWNELYRLAKANHTERQVGALYELAKRFMRVRRMTKRFRNLSLPKKEYLFRYILEGFKSKDFKDIEKAWKIYLPFNKADMEEYK